MSNSAASNSSLLRGMSGFFLTILAGMAIILLVTKISFLVLPALGVVLFITAMVLKKAEYGLYMAALTIPLGFLGPVMSLNGIVTFTRILIFLTLVSLFIRAAAGQGSLHFGWTRKDLILILLSLVLIMSALTGIDLEKSATGLFHYLNSFLIYIVVVLIVHDRIRYVHLVYAILLGLTVALLYGIVSYHLGLQGAEQFAGSEVEGSRMTSTEFLGPNAFAMMLVAIFPFPVISYFHEREAKWKFFYIAWACLIFYGTLITFSRASAITLVGIAFYLLVRYFKKLNRKEIMSIAIAAVLILSLLPGIVFQRVESLSQGEEDPSIRARWSYLKVGYEIFKDHPLLGVGPQNYKIAFARPEYRQLGYMSQFTVEAGREMGRVGRAAHNLYLQVLNETGILGLSLLLTLFFLTWAEFREAQMRFMSQDEEQLHLVTRSLEIGFVAFLMNSFFLSTGFFPILWFFTGLSSAAVVIAGGSGLEGDRENS